MNIFFQGASFRRALINGLIAGAVVVFFVLIGIPGGTGDADSLPPWFAWGLLMLAVGTFGFFAARPRTVVERRDATPTESLMRGAVVGITAAALLVVLMCAINAGQLWEISRPSTNLATGLRPNITRVQDVFWNVTSRSTAVMSGLSEKQINPSALNGAERADPTFRFFLMACLLPLAGVIGAGVNVLSRRRSEVRTTSAVAEPPQWRAWLPIGIPLAVFAFIVLNQVFAAKVGSGGLVDSYLQLIGGNAQLIGLLASFVLIASALLAIREVDTTPVSVTATTTAMVTRALPSIILIVILCGVGILFAPSRSANDMLFSPKAPSLSQINDANGQPQVVPETLAPISDEQLLSYQRAAILVVGLLFILGNLFAARGTLSPRRLFALNVLLGTLAIMPLFLDKYQQSVLLLVGINVLLGLGLNIVVGYAGLLDLGYVAFYAIGAYAYAFLSSNEKDGNTLKFFGNHESAANMSAALLIGLIISGAVIWFGLNWWRGRSSQPVVTGQTKQPGWLAYVLVGGSIALSLLVIGLLQGTALYASFGGFPIFAIGLLVGVVCAGTAGVLLGIPVLRLRGDYLAIVTLGFGEIIRLFLNNLKTITGGPQGLLGIPHAAVGNVELGSNEGLLYLALLGCLLVAIVSLRLKSSRLGRAWSALSSDEDIAQAMGINVTNTKVLAFAIGAAFAGVAGVIFASRQGSIFPENFTLDQSINVLSLIIIGGMGSIPGVIVGALVLVGIPESLRVFQNYRILAFGALLITMMIVRPRGLLPQPPQPLEARAATLSRKESPTS